MWILFFSFWVSCKKKKMQIKNEWLKIRLSKYRHNSHLWLNYPIELTVYEFMSEVDCYRRLKKKSLFTNFIPFSAANVRKQCLIGPFTWRKHSLGGTRTLTLAFSLRIHKNSAKKNDWLHCSVSCMRFTGECGFTAKKTAFLQHSVTWSSNKEEQPLWNIC